MKVIVEGLAVDYAEDGQGPGLLILHGWGNTKEYFDSLVRDLKGFRTIRLDLPGFGGSEMPKKPWDVEAYARFVSAFCEKIRVNPEFMLGHSFGGRIITKGVGDNILHPQKIVLMASAGVADRKTARNILYAALAKIGKVILMPFPKSFYERMRKSLYARTGSDYLTTGEMSKTFLNMIREDLSSSAARIQIPTLFIWGEKDAVTPLSEGKKLHALVPHSKFVVIPEAGHFVYRDESSKVVEEIRAFL